MSEHLDERAAGRRLLRHYTRQREETRKRVLLLEPNRDSKIPIGRYTMAIEAAQAIPASPHVGPPTVALTGIQAPDCNFRPQRFTTNVPAPGFVVISMAKVANVNIVVGGSIDAWQWNANARDSQLDVPMLTPANSASFTALYTGLVYSPFTDHASSFVMGISGPASISGLLELEYDDEDDVTEPI
jgi:hypothetical protein